MEGKKRFIFLGLCIGVMLGSSYIMFLAFNKAVGDPFLTVLVIVAVWVVGFIGLWLRFRRWGWTGKVPD